MTDYTFTVTISEEEYRAFNLIVPDADEWVENAIQNKTRKCLIRVAERVSQDPSGLLSDTDRQAIEAEMLAQGDTMKAPKDYSKAVKKMIAAKTTMKNRVDRDADTVSELIK